MSARFVETAAALVVIYLFGFVTGSLLVAPLQDRSVAMGAVRMVAGLQLTAVGFLAALLLALPWFLPPVGLLALALVRHRLAALALPRAPADVTLDGVWGALAAMVALAPLFVASISMATGPFPPVFFHVDSPYFLEKVHSLVNANAFPPESLSNAGGRFVYQFGVHGITAFIARSSGLAAHHALFLIVLPLLGIGVLSAAVLLARQVSPSLPWRLSLPMLLTGVPTLWYPFWDVLAPAIGRAAATASLDPLLALRFQYELWGVASNQGQNVVSLFLVLAAIAGITGAGTWGWRLPVFLVGSALLFKAPTGVALTAGLCLAQAVRTTTARSLRPLVPAIATVGVFGGVYAAFWLGPALPADYHIVPYLGYHLSGAQARGLLPGVLADLAWLLLPVLVLLPVTRNERRGTALLLALLTLAPFVVVNVFRSFDLRPDRSDNNDWLQILMPVPIIVRALALSVAESRWARAGAALRVTFAAVVAVSVVPPLLVGAWYTGVLIGRPKDAHEFADNRAIAGALASIPLEGTLIVTNSLEYPAGSRRERQMQIPAVFGHRAFAVNYAYESFPFSPERRELQRLLEADGWSEAIETAAREYGWTHLLIRKDRAHPKDIPLTQVFDSERYAVYRFGPS